MADAQVSKTCGHNSSWRFDSSPRHIMAYIGIITMSSIDRDIENWPQGRLTRDDALAANLHAAGNKLVDGDKAEAQTYFEDILMRAPKFASLSFWTKKELVMQKQNFNMPLSRLEKLFANKNGIDIKNSYKV